MTAQTLAANDLAASTPAAPPVDPGAHAPAPDDASTAHDAPERRGLGRRSGWIMAAIAVLALIVAGTYVSASLHKHQNSNGLFAPETVPLAVADAQAAAAKAKAAAASARGSAAAAASSTTSATGSSPALARGQP